jgi:hypothetical protein
MNTTYRLYIGSKVGDVEWIDLRKVEHCLENGLRHFSIPPYYSVFQGTGSYGETKENCFQVMIASKLFTEKFIELAGFIAVFLNQETVGLEFHGQFILVDAYGKVID